MALPYHWALPYRALYLIREFSKPLTRPDWRSLHKLTNYELFYYISHTTIYYDVCNTLMYNIRETPWYCMYLYVEVWGIEKAAIKYNTSTYDLLQINGMYYALINHNLIKKHLNRNYE
jgi:hypothetical protein